ncbi:low temperature requirement protein A [Mycetocola tolaasinivorans]|uniref:Low temperature requirement protein A n=1 Tax=Mycetocola tolaasinivorans TaxID=76635 RepID=A0A3L7A246_9MICO|nr:low temperature requirement protein A [Mycetocola tolaasinivorans]RLP74144.1 low temperature requirement protein A [Mycetocola tolaasinivorans]
MSDAVTSEQNGRAGFGLRRMLGRDPAQRGRVATPLELLFDLTFVVAFGQAGNLLAHLLAEGHTVAAVGGFSYAICAIVLAWINFTWFASAFDTDDWVFRITTMVQMVGVLVLALGLPAMFHSIDVGHGLDNGVMVAGYVIMRVAMVVQWLRAAAQDPRYRRASLANAALIAGAQIGWVALIFADPTVLTIAIVSTLLFALEFGGPLILQLRGWNTPWHAHHIAERYGLLTIIALGEGLIGTIASVSAVLETQGWSLEAVLLAVAGTGLTFALWWTYFVSPSGEVLHHHRARGLLWGYGHIAVFASIAAVGAGLHVAAYVVEGEAAIGPVGALLATAIPVAIFLVGDFLLHSYLIRELDPFYVWLLLGSCVMLALAVYSAAIGVSIGWSLMLVLLAPVVVILGYEIGGRERLANTLDRAIG